MGRPRAGHAWSRMFRGNRSIHILFGEVSGWITSGQAQGWRRCSRCRKPIEASPFESELCVHCYFYRSGLPVDEFWRIHETGYPLAPYNIGRRIIATHHPDLATSPPT